MHVSNNFSLRSVALANFLANAAIGTAAATVDVSSSFSIPQTTANIALTIPNPTTSVPGQFIQITNSGKTGVRINGFLVAPGTTVDFIWSGAAWTSLLVTVVPTTIPGAYTLTQADNGKILDFTSAAAVNLTVPNTLPIGFQVSITQAGAGVITFVGSGGMVISQRWGGTKTNGQWSKAGLEVRAVNSCVLTGDVG